MKLFNRNSDQMCKCRLHKREFSIDEHENNITIATPDIVTEHSVKPDYAEKRLILRICLGRKLKPNIWEY